MLQIQAVNWQQIKYREKDVVRSLKKFYESGNRRLVPSLRHRKEKTGELVVTASVDKLDLKRIKNEIVNEEDFKIKSIDSKKNKRAKRELETDPWNKSQSKIDN